MNSVSKVSILSSEAKFASIFRVMQELAKIVVSLPDDDFNDKLNLFMLQKKLLTDNISYMPTVVSPQLNESALHVTNTIPGSPHRSNDMDLESMPRHQSLMTLLQHSHWRNRTNQLSIHPIFLSLPPKKIHTRRPNALE